MRTTITAGLAALVLTAGSALLPQQTSAQDSFSKAQTEELHTIIRDYLLENPAILNEMIAKLQAAERDEQHKQARDAIAQNAKQLFHNENDVVVGNPDGNVTMVEFFDYNCGYCKRSTADVLRLIEEDKDLRIVMKEFPILSEGSVIASRAALASKEQGKYWDFHLALMASRGSIGDEDKVMSIAAEAGLDVEKLKADMAANAEAIERDIDANRALAQAIGINGTPAFVIDDTLVPGAMPYDQLATSVRIVRENGGCQFC